MVTRKKILKTFLDLVVIDSPSGHENKVSTYITKYLRQLRIKTVRDRYKNLIAHIPGQGDPLLLSAHMDTVDPGRGIKPIVKGDIIRTNGKTILGADDKAGIAEILEVIAILKKQKIIHRPLELVFTREEETGLKGAFNLNYKKIKAKEGLVLDSSRPPGHITIAAPFIYMMDIKVIGRAAHAGAFPEKGINAIQTASRAMAELKLGRINKSTTNNIGVIKGGTVANAVPEMVEIKAEARSHFREKALEQVDLINKEFKKSVRRSKAKLYFKSQFGCAGYNYLRSEPIIKKIVRVNKEIGINSVFEKSGGASDANVYAGKGIKAIDISIGGKNCHTTKESVKISEMQKLVKFTVLFVQK